MYIVKRYENLPAAHRQPNHKGHCSKIHGHNWAFDLYFTAAELDVNNFVVDVGQLGFLKTWLNDIFDHTLLLNADDPKLSYYQRDPDIDVRVVPNCSMEGIAAYVHALVNKLLFNHLRTDVETRGLACSAVHCFEDSKNSYKYEP